ncbi:MAG: hypothetical protein ABJA35_06145, partial [Parafilimonas sp.]
MKCKHAYISGLFFFLLMNCSIAQTDTILSATDLKPYGRSLIDQQKNLELISSAVHFSFSFTGSACTLYAFLNDAAGHSYLQYELDGVYQKRFKITGDSVQQIELTANNDGEHTIE